MTTRDLLRLTAGLALCALLLAGCGGGKGYSTKPQGPAGGNGPTGRGNNAGYTGGGGGGMRPGGGGYNR